MAAGDVLFLCKSLISLLEENYCVCFPLLLWGTLCSRSTQILIFFGLSHFGLLTEHVLYQHFCFLFCATCV